MERKGELLYQRFLNTAQETVRLTAALEGFFLEADIEESQRDAYAAYLKRRIRPAMERLIRENALEKMDVLEQRGWVGAQEMDAFIRQAQSLGQEAAMLWLMRRKGERYALCKGQGNPLGEERHESLPWLPARVYLLRLPEQMLPDAP